MALDFTITTPTNAIGAGTPSRAITLTLAGSGTLGSIASFALTDGGAGGSFYPASPAAIASGQTVGATIQFVYIPAAAASGTITLQAACTGGLTATHTLSLPIATNATVFLHDSFAGTSGTLLSVHTPDVGGTWTKESTPSLAGIGNAKLNGSGKVYNGDTGAPVSASIYNQSVTASTTEFDVAVDFVVNDLTVLCAPTLLVNSIAGETTNNGYFFQVYNGTPGIGWAAGVFVAGTATSWFGGINVPAVAVGTYHALVAIRQLNGHQWIFTFVNGTFMNGAPNQDDAYTSKLIGLYLYTPAGMTQTTTNGIQYSALFGRNTDWVATATKLAITTQPPTATPTATAFGLAVSAQDASSALIASYTANVTVAIGTNPGSGTLSGTATVAAVAGVATFTGLSINNAGVGYTLTATSGALTGATSNAFTITAGSGATAFTLTGPASGYKSNASTNFTITPNGVYSGTITITPSGGGLSTPIVKTFSSSATAQTFTITPTAVGTVTLTPTNSGSLTNPSAVTYTSNPQTLAVTPGALPTSSTMPETFTGGGTLWLTSTPTFTPSGVAGVSCGAVIVDTNTQARANITTGTATGTFTWTDSTTGATVTEVVAAIVSVLSIGEGFATGLSTVGYAVYDASGALISAWTTTGVVERGTASGDYGAIVPLAQDGTDYEIRWSQTSGTTPPFVHDIRTALGSSANVTAIAGSAAAATNLAAQMLAQFNGVVSADATATTTSFTANTTGSPGLSATASKYVGSLVAFAGSSEKPAARKITAYSYSGGVGTFTIAPALAAAPLTDGTAAFVVLGFTP